MERKESGSLADDIADDNNDSDHILTQLKNEGTRSSSAHSTAPLSDSITASEFEYGNDSRTDLMNLNESLSNFDAMLQARGNGGGRTQRLNSSFGSLNKTTSVRNFEGSKPVYARRRSSVHGCTPSELYHLSPTFHTEFKASVDDWNSELPVDDDDDYDGVITSSYSQLNASIQSIRSPTATEKVKVSTTIDSTNTNTDSSLPKTMKSPSSKQQGRKLKKTKSQIKDVADGNDAGVTTTGKSSSKASSSSAPAVTTTQNHNNNNNSNLPQPPSRSLMPVKSSLLKSKSSSVTDCATNSNEKISWNRVQSSSSSGGSTKHNKDRKAAATTVVAKLTGSFSSKLESRFARCIRGGMSFRSTDSTKSNHSMSKSDHNNNYGQKNKRMVLVEGTSAAV